MMAVADPIDAIFRAWDRPDSPGCALGVFQNGDIVYAKEYGSANLEYDVPITPSSVFHVASVSKQFTAACVLLLALEGRLSLDDDVRVHVPELPEFGHRITLRHLIHHTSGLRDQWDLLYLAGWRADDVKTNQDVLDLTARQRALNFGPGDEHLYCNTGYTLLGIVVERVTGQSLRAFAHERIFAPLGMTSTHFHDDHTVVVKNRAMAYVPRPEGGVRISIPAFDTVGATSLFTTVEDLGRWVQNFFEPRVGGRAFVEQMVEPGRLNSGTVLDYAFGLALDEHRGLRTIGHSGGDAGYRSHLLWFPERRFVIAILCNLGTIKPGDLALQVADIFLADEMGCAGTVQVRPPGSPIALSGEQAARLAGIYRDPTTEMIRRISVENGKLVVRDGGAYAMVPLDTDRFNVEGWPGEVRFVPSPETGALDLHQVDARGKGTVYHKVQPANPTTDGLAQYVGSYRSVELSTTYDIVQRDGALTLRRPKFPDRILDPTFGDAFTLEEGKQMVFSRDARGSVEGFGLYAWRSGNLRFARVP